MKIGGMQKVSLIDYPKKITCTLFLHGCNFKCGFCHNPELVVEPLREEISEREIFDYLETRKKYLESVCITGGEPLMNLDKAFLRKIKERGFLIKIDTNGSFPERLKEIIDEKLVDFVAMDIKISKDEYEKLVNSIVDINKIEKSMKIISSSGIDYEFRTTVIENIHNKENMRKMAEWVVEVIGKKIKKFVLQGFKNNGKFVDKAFNEKWDTSEKYLNELKEAIRDYCEEIEVRV